MPDLKLLRASVIGLKFRTQSQVADMMCGTVSQALASAWDRTAFSVGLHRPEARKHARAINCAEQRVPV